MLADMSLVRLEKGVMTIACDERITATAEKKLPELGKLLTSLAGREIRCEIAHGQQPETPAADRLKETTESGDEVEIDDPVVKHAIEIFKGRIVEVKPLAQADERES